MNTYKLRVEFLKDALAVLRELHQNQDAVNSKIIPSYLDSISIPDCELEFDSALTLKQVKNKIQEAEKNSDPEEGIELHVALETVQPIKKYTGERNA